MLRITLAISLICCMHAGFGQLLSNQQLKELKAQLQRSSDTSKVELLLKLALHHQYKEGAKDADIDSALNLAKQAEQLSRDIGYNRGLGKSYWVYSQAYREHGETEKGMQSIDVAIDVLTRFNCLNDLGEAFVEKRLYYSAFASREELSARIDQTRKALAAFKESNNTLRQAQCLQELGDLYGIQTKTIEAIQVLNESLQLYKKVGYKHIHGVYDLLGALYADMDNYQEGIRYGLLAVQTAESLGDSSLQLATIYNHLGHIYYYVGNSNMAISYYNKSLGIAEKKGDLHTIHYLANNIARVLYQNNKLVEALQVLEEFQKKYRSRDLFPEGHLTNYVDIYVKLNNLSRAREYYDQLVKVLESKKHISDPDRSIAYKAIIHFLFAVHRYEEAEKYLEKDKILGEEARSLRTLYLYHYWSFKLDSTRRNYLSAITHFHEYKFFSDSMLNQTKTREIAQLQIQYEIEKKDQALKLNEQNIELLTRRSQLQETRLEQAQFIRNTIIGGAVMLVLLLGLLYNRYRLKQRSNKQLHEQQKEISKKNQSLQHLLHEKEWLVKEIHHRVKNNFHSVVALLGTQQSYLKSDEAISAIAESQHRIQSMSMIHQKLYQSDSLSLVNFSDYIHELVAYLTDSLSVGKHIRFTKEIDDVKLDISRSIPIGLILNEAITNAIKHAFDGRSEGTIAVSLRQTENNFAILSIVDDGIGLPSDFDLHSANSMGMNLMKGLSHEIKGIFAANSNNGTQVTITFRTI